MNLAIHRGVKVLYVDPDTEKRQAMLYALSDYAEVQACDDPINALRALKDDPDTTIVVAGLDLPGMDGNAFWREVKRINPCATRVLISDGEDLDARTLAHAEGVCHKWLDKADLANAPKLVQFIHRASQEHARRYVGDLMSRHRAAIHKRLYISGVSPEAAEQSLKPNLRPIVRLVGLLRDYVDISYVEYQLLKLAADWHDMDKLVLGSETGESSDTYSVFAELLEELDGLEPVQQAILELEERFNGTGLLGKKREQISVLGRLLAVFVFFNDIVWNPDTYGANTTVAMDHALQRMQEAAGKWLDPEAVAVFWQMADAHPGEVKRLYAPVN